MNENKNLILAVVLSALVLLGWSFLSDKFVPSNPPPVKVENGKVEPMAQTAGEPGAEHAGGDAQPRSRSSRHAARAHPDAGAAGLDQPSGRPDRRPRAASRARRHRQGLAARASAFARWRTGRLFRVLRLVAARASRRRPPTRSWTASAPVLAPSRPVTLSWTSNGRPALRDHLQRRRQLSLHRPAARVEPDGQRRSPSALTGSSAAPTKSPDPDSWTVHVGPIGVFNDAANYDVDFSTLDEEAAGRQFNTGGGWLGFTDKYWLTALAPAGNRSFAASFRKGADGRLPGRLLRRAGDRRAGQGRHDRNPAVRRRQGEEAARPLRGPRHSEAVQGDRLGLVRMVHAADFRPAELAVQADRQLRRGDHLPDADRPRWSCSRSPTSSSSRWPRCARSSRR